MGAEFVNMENKDHNAKDCGRSQICEHDKRRSKCKDCVCGGGGGGEGRGMWGGGEGDGGGVFGVKFVITTNKDQDARIVAEVKFVSTTR